MSQKTSWFMLQRIRNCFGIETEQLTGTVEIDESLLGGKKEKGWSGEGKVLVLGMVERKGRVISKVVINKRNSSSLDRTTYKIRFLIMTDKLWNNNDFDGYFEHSIITHKKMYVEGIVHTNTIEGMWSLKKRVFFGTFHWMSDEHYQKYLNEYDFRYNTRDYTEQERFKYFFENFVCRKKWNDTVFHLWYPYKKRSKFKKCS